MPMIQNTVSEIGKDIVINEDTKKQKIVEIFSDQNTRAILSAIVTKSKSASEISDESKIPLNTVYRKLHRLVENRMIAISGCIDTRGRRNYLYKSKIRSLRMAFTNEGLAIHVITNGTCKICAQQN